MSLAKNKLVSVIIPTYNRQHRVKEAVCSVLNQTYPHYELIVVDDGSCDNTQKALLPFRSKLTYIFQSNAGPSCARNKGINLSRGQWITFLDSDDLWKPEKLEKQISVLHQKPQFKICYTGERWIRGGQFVNPGKKHRKYSGWIYPRCLPLCIISPSSVMIHRSIMEKIGCFDPGLPVAEDYDLWLRISSRYPILFVPRRLITKRGGHPDQLSGIYWGIDRFRIVSLQKMLKKNHLPLSWRIATLKQLSKKASIVAAGSRKRGKLVEYHFYHSKAVRAKQEIARLRSHYNREGATVKR